VISFTPRPLYLQETTPVPTEEEAGWAPEKISTFRRRGCYVDTAGIRTPDLPARSLVTVPTTKNFYYIQ
jgi:hypothetical protein